MDAERMTPCKRSAEPIVEFRRKLMLQHFRSVCSAAHFYSLPTRFLEPVPFLDLSACAMNVTQQPRKTMNEGHLQLLQEASAGRMSNLCHDGPVSAPIQIQAGSSSYATMCSGTVSDIDVTIFRVAHAKPHNFKRVNRAEDDITSSDFSLIIYNILDATSADEAL
eukprot:8884239-Karenia_brevis.AAC.1